MQAFADDRQRVSAIRAVERAREAAASDEALAESIMAYHRQLDAERKRRFDRRPKARSRR
jgi:hypothetical protein